jgi:hypothetical protein
MPVVPPPCPHSCWRCPGHHSWASPGYAVHAYLVLVADQSSHRLEYDAPVEEKSDVQ